MIGRIKNFLSAEELEISYREAAKTFRSRKERELQKAREREKKLVSRTGKILEELEKAIEHIEGYEDEQGLTAVEDVAGNLYRSRKKILEEFRPPKNIRAHREKLGEFIDDFNDVSRKEGIVLQRIEKDSGELSEKIQELVDHSEKIENFLNKDYQVVNNLEKIEELVNEKERLEKEIQDLEDSRKTDFSGIEEEIAGIEEKIQQLESSKAWKRKESLEDKIQEKEEQKKKKLSELSKTVSSIERSLKKILYSIKNGDTKFENSIKEIEKLKEKKFRKIGSLEPELRNLTKLVKDKEMLEQKNRQKFINGAEQLLDFDNQIQSIRSLEEEKAELEEELEGIDVEEKRKRLEKRKKKAEDKLERKNSQASKQEEKIRQKRNQLSRKKTEIDRFMQEKLSADIILKDS